jgi:hypothetical protein
MRVSVTPSSAAECHLACCQVNAEVPEVDESLAVALTDFAPALCRRWEDESLKPGSPRAVTLKAAFARGFPYAGYR